MLVYKCILTLTILASSMSMYAGEDEPTIVKQDRPKPSLLTYLNYYIAIRYPGIQTIGTEVFTEYREKYNVLKAGQKDAMLESGHYSSADVREAEEFEEFFLRSDNAATIPFQGDGCIEFNQFKKILAASYKAHLDRGNILHPKVIHKLIPYLTLAEGGNTVNYQAINDANISKAARPIKFFTTVGTAIIVSVGLLAYLKMKDEKLQKQQNKKDF